MDDESYMSTGEASLFLQEFLIGSGFKSSELDGIATHSLKCTLLSYVAKGNYLPLPDRRALGHHLEAGDNSAITYSRDELSRLMVRVEQMLQDIRVGDFKPDDRRVQRIAEQSGATGRDDFLTEAEDGSEDSDDFSAVDLERGPMGLKPSMTCRWKQFATASFMSTLVFCMYFLMALPTWYAAERRPPTISDWKRHLFQQMFRCVSNAQSRSRDISPYHEGKTGGVLGRWHRGQVSVHHATVHAILARIITCKLTACILACNLLVDIHSLQAILCLEDRIANHSTSKS